MHSLGPNLAVQKCVETALFGLCDACIFCGGGVCAALGEAHVGLCRADERVGANCAEAEAGGHGCCGGGESVVRSVWEVWEE
jgi:hypothetical protein